MCSVVAKAWANTSIFSYVRCTNCQTGDTVNQNSRVPMLSDANGVCVTNLAIEACWQRAGGPAKTRRFLLWIYLSE